jgi:hypothetical protein
MRSLLPSLLVLLAAVPAAGQEATPRAEPELDLSAARLLRHGAQVLSVGISSDGGVLATGGENGRLRFWNPRSAFLPTSSDGLPTILDFGIDGPLSALAFSPDGSRIAFAGGQAGAGGETAFEIRIESVQTGKAEAPLRLRGHTGPVLALAYARRGDCLVSAGADGSVRIWTLATPATPRVLAAHARAVTGLQISPTGRTLYTCSADGSVREWDFETGDARVQFQTGATPVSTIALSPDGRLLASGETTGKIRIREVFSGLEIGGFDGHPGGVTALRFAPDGRFLASGGYDGRIRLWSPRGGASRVGTIRAWVKSIACAPDGTWIAAGLADGSALVLRAPQRDAEPEAPKSLDLAKLWADLGERDARKAVEAIHQWSALGSRGGADARVESLAFLKEHLAPVPKGRLEELLRQLDDEEYEVRVRASGELERYGRAAEPALRRTLQGNPSAEVRDRVTAILKKMTGSAIGSPDVLRVLRGIEILERIDSKDTREILEAIAGGAESAKETLEARSSLERLRAKAAR